MHFIFRGKNEDILLDGRLKFQILGGSSNTEMISSEKESIQLLWVDAARAVDRHALFRASFDLEAAGPVEFRLFGGSWFKVWLDGEFLADGPARHQEKHPEAETAVRHLAPGCHVLAWHAHEMGVDTRLTRGDGPVGLFASAKDAAGREVSLRWKCCDPGAWRATKRRLGCVLGWVEWCDRRKLPAGWLRADFDDAGWAEPVARAMPCAAFPEVPIGALRRPVAPGTEIGRGELVNMSMIDHDPTSGFFIRELENHTLPAQGRWWRFDLGRVRLGYPRLRVRTAPGAVVQIAYAESLTGGRVHPYLKTGGGDDSCMLDHWVTGGGEEELVPLHPKGARFVEVHILGGKPENAELAGFAFEERAYYPEESEGAFSCGDPRLDRAWEVGRDTLVACSEDCVTDNPHRERGQWLGEIEGPCIEMISACFSDWRPLRRSLEQAALCASPEGLLPAIYPGTRQYIPSFAIQWVRAVADYVRHTGDRGLLEPLHAAAEKNLAVFFPDLTDAGLRVNPGYWNFIDWGYRGAGTVFLEGAKDDVTIDRALSLFYLDALDSLALWSSWIGKEDRAAEWRGLSDRLRAGMRRELESVEREGSWDAYGYHATALALRCGLVEREADAVAYLKGFLLGCFPNNPDAPRLSDVTVESANLMTPYFAHFSFPELARRGEVEFVLGQIRTCWGWMLDQGWTTWAEVFDPRWSHCHYWSATPTWMLSRCALGLTPAFDRGYGHYDWTFRPGGLDRAEGRIPLPSVAGEPPRRIEISWSRQAGGGFRHEILSPVELAIRNGAAETVIPANRKTIYQP
jgi:hypothetical protein